VAIHGWTGGRKMIISMPVIIIVLMIIAAGYTIMQRIIYKKWGYTEKREKELEETGKISSR